MDTDKGRCGEQEHIQNTKEEENTKVLKAENTKEKE
jgi:hypothetical protein